MDALVAVEDSVEDSEEATPRCSVREYIIIMFIVLYGVQLWEKYSTVRESWTMSKITML